MPEQKKIIFVVRAYNDLDIQASLINEFAQDTTYDVVVLAGFFDNEIVIADHYEGYPFLKSQGVQFLNVLDDGGSFLTKWVYRAYKTMMSSRKQCPASILFFIRAMLFVVRKIMQRQARIDQNWLEYTKALTPDYVIMDEAVVQKGRSKIVDEIIPIFKQRGTKVFAILTGHHIYFDTNPSNSEKQISYLNHITEKHFVPAQLDVDISQNHFPDEKYVVKGNLRMNPVWVSRMYDDILIPPHFPYADYEKKLPTGKYKVVLMLSKLTYGVRVPELAKCIKYLNDHPDVSLVIKPHTRGMKFDFMNANDVYNAVIADTIPSAVLCKWADIQLFTGSSIAFHSMALGKSVGFLGYCQEIRTIFDEYPICFNFSSQSHLEETMQQLIEGNGDALGPDAQAVNDFLFEHVWGGAKGGQVAKAYKTEIEGS